MARILILACLVFGSVPNAIGSEDQYITYESYSSQCATEEAIAEYEKNGNAYICTNKIKKCNPYDYSRLDGSCNNLRYPALGSFNSAMDRLLPAQFGENFSVRTAEDGTPLTAERKVRTELLAEGKASHPYLTMLFGHFFISLFVDVVSPHDSSNIMANTTTCCTPEGKYNDICAPLEVPEDDPVHRHSGIRCMNQTKPLTFQYYGCAGQDTVPTRIGNFTHQIDLSQIYHPTPNAMELARTFKGGLLKYTEINGLKLPLNGTNTPCLANKKPTDKYCFYTMANNIIGPNMMGIFFYILHNDIATELGVINPCWSDHKLFHETRNLVIAIWSQIQFYEVLPCVLGRNKMVEAGLISRKLGFRHLYDPSLSPAIPTEFTYTGRYFHTMQEGTLELFNRAGEFVKEIPLTDMTLALGRLANDDNLEMITLGSIRQRYGGHDYIVDPNIAETGLGSILRSVDIFTNDLSKGRYLGLPPYVEYKKKYNPEAKYECFEDLTDIDEDRLLSLMKVYNSTYDIDLLAGLWAEKHYNGATPLLSDIMIETLLHMIKSNRFWYEDNKRPHAMTLGQLLQVRKMTAASILCAVGEGITEIQPKAMYMPGPGNEMRSCDFIPKLDLWPWKDPKCNAHGYY